MAHVPTSGHARSMSRVAPGLAATVVAQVVAVAATPAAPPVRACIGAFCAGVLALQQCASLPPHPLWLALGAGSGVLALAWRAACAGRGQPSSATCVALVALCAAAGFAFAA